MSHAHKVPRVPAALAPSVCNFHLDQKMMAGTGNATYDLKLSTPAASSIKIEAAAAAMAESSSHLQQQQQHESGRPYYGKCQYKTGKCFNERTLKRNGEVHSLCEEHRIKQNLIQRRSDRKYQTVHAIRRRERSQRRAVLKKQVSMAVAQQLFYEHQQQKTLGLQLASHHPSLSSLGADRSGHPASLAPPIQIPGKLDISSYASPYMSSSAEGLASPILSFTTPSAFGGNPRKTSTSSATSSTSGGDLSDDEAMIKDEHPTSSSMSGASGANNVSKPEDGTPTGIDDFAPDSFLNLCCSDEADALGNFVPILSARAERQLWSEDDIDFLHTLLLA